MSGCAPLEFPADKVDFSVEPQGDHFIVKGTLHQTGVPSRFVANVPLYAARGGSEARVPRPCRDQWGQNTFPIPFNLLTQAHRHRSRTHSAMPV